MMQNFGKKLYKNKFVLKMSICGFILGSIYSILGDEFHYLDNLKTIIVTQSNIDIKLPIITFFVLLLQVG